MAIDTDVKRFSMMHSFGGFCALPVPSGTVGAGPRFLILNLYSGIADPGGAGGGGGLPGAGAMMMIGLGG
jgi:hypothetical protein